MPYASQKNCARGGCYKASIYGRRYCPEHTKQKDKADYEIYRKDSPYQKLYKTKPWAVTRRYHLAENPFCVECLKLDIQNATDIEVDHIIPLKRFEGDPLDPTNLQSLCPTHHAQKTRRGE
jgi:5-methylcytosine-specific restriction endonuclease McrA